ncbi:hypothetical protein TSAR_012167 [Trichomalopsis sarcophagae]|uniref:Uncharacterized protein n=1 Tax=Trichomalopsis sarcophagae TaxID=543379 RepID=A0A232FKT3_9HYME|nr:hypothetical protein TSAR_012167 [Trichomalopsis sarcophagae]
MKHEETVKLEIKTKNQKVNILTKIPRKKQQESWENISAICEQKNRIFDFDKDERFSDIRGILGEQSRIVGTAKDYDEPSTNSLLNTSLTDDQAQIDFKNPVNKVTFNIQEITREKQNSNHDNQEEPTATIQTENNEGNQNQE